MQKITSTIPFELGWFTLAKPAAALDETKKFYFALGFAQVGGHPEHGYAVFGNGHCEVTSMGFLTEYLLNFRGGAIDDLSERLEALGFELDGHNRYDPSKWPANFHTDEDGNEIPCVDSGDFKIVDSDGNVLYFDSVPVERVRYEAGELRSTDEAQEVTPDPDLGRFLLHLPVADLDAAIAYYARLGLSACETHSAEPEAVVVGNGQRVGFEVALVPNADSPWLQFAVDDVAAIVAQLQAREIDVSEVDGVAMLNDPDGLEIRIVPRP